MISEVCPRASHSENGICHEQTNCHCSLKPPWSALLSTGPHTTVFAENRSVGRNRTRESKRTDNIFRRATNTINDQDTQEKKKIFHITSSSSHFPTPQTTSVSPPCVSVPRTPVSTKLQRRLELPASESLIHSLFVDHGLIHIQRLFQSLM